MSELPTGTVTFLFPDIEGSARLLRELGDEYRAVQDSPDLVALDQCDPGSQARGPDPPEPPAQRRTDR